MRHLDEEKQILSRRTALKALAATGSATILSVLPAKWEQPVVKVGALPAFAVVSPTPTMTATLAVTPTPIVAPTGTLAPTPTATTTIVAITVEHTGPFPSGGELYSGRISYNDPGGQMLADQAKARLTFEFLPAGNTAVSEVTLSGANIGGTASSGIVVLTIPITFGTATSVNLTILLINAAGENISQGMVNIPKPGTP